MFHFYKSLTYFLSSFHQKDDDLLVDQCLGIQIPPDKGIHWARSLHFPKSEDFSLVGLVNSALIWSSLCGAFFKITKMEMKLLVQDEQMFH